jgi:hypothetical protein
MRISRRELLRVGLVGAGGLTFGGALGGLLEACGGSHPDVLTAGSVNGLLKARKDAGDGSKLVVPSLAGEDYVAGVDNYLGFYLAKPNGDRLFGTDTRVWLAQTSDADAKVTPLGPKAAPWFGYANPEPGPTVSKGLNGLQVTFDRSGVWTMVVETTTAPRQVATTLVQVKDRAKAETLLPGDKAIPSDTPTVDNARGVSPICTRKPACDMHQITLRQAIASGKPTAFVIATPAYCASRNCGPSVDELLTVESDLKGKANFVHAEVYLNDQSQTLQQQIPSPTFAEWKVQTEPWLFVIDRNGVIASRFEGGFTAGQVRTALNPLVG